MHSVSLPQAMLFITTCLTMAISSVTAAPQVVSTQSLQPRQGGPSEPLASGSFSPHVDPGAAQKPGFHSVTIGTPTNTSQSFGVLATNLSISVFYTNDVRYDSYALQNFFSDLRQLVDCTAPAHTGPACSGGDEVSTEPITVRPTSFVGLGDKASVKGLLLTVESTGATHDQMKYAATTLSYATTQEFLPLDRAFVGQLVDGPKGIASFTLALE